MRALALLALLALAVPAAAQPAPAPNCAVVLDGVWDIRAETPARDRLRSFALFVWLRDFADHESARAYLAVLDFDLDRLPFRPQRLTPAQDFARWSAELLRLDPGSAAARPVAAYVQAGTARVRRVWEECFRADGLRLSWRLGTEPERFTLLLRWNPPRPQASGTYLAWHEIAPPVGCLLELKAIHLLGPEPRELACERREAAGVLTIRVIADAAPVPELLIVPPLRAPP